MSRVPVLLACDLDGTLLDNEATPVPGARTAGAELVHAGAVFAVVTGRPLQAARRATAALGVEPLVYACYHGALVVEAAGRVLRHLPLPRREAERTMACGDGAADEALLAAAAVRIAVGETPHTLRHLPGVIVARRPDPYVARAAGPSAPPPSRSSGLHVGVTPGRALSRPAGAWRSTLRSPLPDGRSPRVLR